MARAGGFGPNGWRLSARRRDDVFAAFLLPGRDVFPHASPGLKVAVVIPLYNHEKFIGAALASLRAQTRRPDRVVILDDGSTDQSLVALVNFADGLPPEDDTYRAAGGGVQTQTEVLKQANAGAHATINRLLTMVDDCDYVAVLNSDDCYHPDRIARCLEVLEAHPTVDLVCTRLRLIDETGVPLPADAPRARWFAAAWSFGASTDDTSPLDLAEWLGLANFPGTTSNFFARTSYLRAHPFEDYRFAHDYYALVLAALENKLAVLDEELLDYRIHSSNTISTEPEHLIREMLRVNLDLACALGPRLPAEPELRAAFARYQRAAWNNVSAFRADLFNLVLVEALVLLPPPLGHALLDAIDDERFPEIRQFPNRAIVNAHDPAKPTMGPVGGLADKFYTLKAQLSAARNSARPWAEYRQLQAALLESRWFALGGVLGLVQRITKAGGKTGPEKLAILRERVLRSPWLRLGNRLGVPSAGRAAGDGPGETLTFPLARGIAVPLARTSAAHLDLLQVRAFLQAEKLGVDIVKIRNLHARDRLADEPLDGLHVLHVFRVKIVSASPSFCARPVRPMRWT